MNPSSILKKFSRLICLFSTQATVILYISFVRSHSFELCTFPLPLLSLLEQRQYLQLPLQNLMIYMMSAKMRTLAAQPNLPLSQAQHLIELQLYLPPPRVLCQLVEPLLLSVVLLLEAQAV